MTKTVIVALVAGGGGAFVMLLLVGALVFAPDAGVNDQYQQPPGQRNSPANRDPGYNGPGNTQQDNYWQEHFQREEERRQEQRLRCLEEKQRNSEHDSNSPIGSDAFPKSYPCWP